MNKRPNRLDNLRETFPKLVELTEQVACADVRERPELSKRDRGLIPVADLVALNRECQLPGHSHRALDNGVTEEELIEAITHRAFHSGWPTALTAVAIAKGVFAERED